MLCTISKPVSKGQYITPATLFLTISYIMSSMDFYILSGVIAFSNGRTQD